MKKKLSIIVSIVVAIVISITAIPTPVFATSNDVTNIGDVNNDGEVNNLDRQVLTRHLAKWEGYEAEKLNLEAADVNEDGEVNNLDRQILTRHLAKWDGYEKLPYGVNQDSDSDNSDDGNLKVEPKPDTGGFGLLF